MKLDYEYTRINATEYFSDDTRAYCQVYLKLQEALQVHILSENRLHLSECEKSKKAWEWKTDSINKDKVQAVDIDREKADLEAESEDFIENLEDEE